MKLSSLIKVTRDDGKTDWNHVGALVAILGVAVTIIIGFVNLRGPSDPRQILQTKGISWSYDNFIAAFREQDTDAVILFAEGGMKLKCTDRDRNDNCRDESLFSLVTGKWFDPKTVDTLLAQKVIDPNYCPVPDAEDVAYAPEPGLSNLLYNARIYVDNAQQSTKQKQLITQICDRPDVLATIRKRVIDLDSLGEAQVTKGVYAAQFQQAKRYWKEAAIILSGDDSFWSKS